MPWFWWGSKNEETPTSALNPELKKFLEEQQPRPYETSETPKPAQAAIEAKRKEPELPDTNKIHEDRGVPPESLYQDGRYAHLWKTYTPTTEITAQTTTPMERMYQARKDRTKSIHRTALENCAFEEEVRQQCLGSVTMASRFLNLCNDETKQYTRCYQLQAKFLQALGYLSESNTTDEHEEMIQMHADKLYHRMMDYEADVDDAKRNGKPIPPLTSVFNPNRPAPTVDQIQIPESVQARLNTPLHQMPPHERELAARVALQEAKIKTAGVEEFFKYSASMNEDRKRRQNMVSRILGEPIAKFIIPDPENAEDKFNAVEKPNLEPTWQDANTSTGQSGKTKG